MNCVTITSHHYRKKNYYELLDTFRETRIHFTLAPRQLPWTYRCAYIMIGQVQSRALRETRRINLQLQRHRMRETKKSNAHVTYLVFYA